MLTATIFRRQEYTPPFYARNPSNSSMFFLENIDERDRVKQALHPQQASPFRSSICYARNLVQSRVRLFRRADALRLRIAARAGLGRWRLVVRDMKVVRNARINGETWWREKAAKAGVSALSDCSGRRVAQGR